MAINDVVRKSHGMETVYRVGDILHEFLGHNFVSRVFIQ